MATIWKLTQFFRADEEIVSGMNCLLAQLSENSQSIVLEDLNQALENPHFVVYLATDKVQDRHRIVGMALIFFQWRPSGWLAEIHDVVVDKDYRGQGLGNMLTERLLEAARFFMAERGQKVTVYLTSKPAREAANQMYQKHGFELVAEARSDKGTNLYKLVIAP